MLSIFCVFKYVQHSLANCARTTKLQNKTFYLLTFTNNRVQYFCASIYHSLWTIFVFNSHDKETWSSFLTGVVCRGSRWAGKFICLRWHLPALTIKYAQYFVVYSNMFSIHLQTARAQTAKQNILFACVHQQSCSIFLCIHLPFTVNDICI